MTKQEQQPPRPTKADIRRYRANLQDEVNGVYLYEQLALIGGRRNRQLGEVYAHMAETERRHQRLWHDKLLAAGESERSLSLKPDWRTRALVLLAKRFGSRFVLPTIVGMEREAETGYDDQPEAVEAGLPREERAHARTLREIARGGVNGDDIAQFEGRHRAIGGNALRAGVLGANDGLVSNLSLVMGVAGADLSPNAILIAGVAGLLAGSISMALGEWVSVQSSRELHQNQLRVEREELEEFPEEERQELVLIYQAKGMTREEAERTAERTMRDKETALNTMAREELGIDPEELGGSPWVAAGASFVLFAVGAIFPVLPYFFTEGLRAVFLSMGFSAIGLFLLGAAITLVTGKGLLYSGARQVLFGLAAAGVTFGIGRAIGVAVAG
jgi:VIT1/CCC1 family predicted Fe2+/Mn2+ transporter